MAESNVDLLQGTLDLLILKALALGPLHGWAIAKRIQQMSKDVLSVGQGSLYPALYRMEERGYITSEPGVSPEGRRITLYKPTVAGRKELAQKIESWEAFVAAMRAVIRYA
ncbi:MAG TPA: PadR family transcriptional regulator [Gemmatimonadaceae bacterium]|jgi:transcriptional regulator